VLTRQGTGKTQSALAQDALARIGAQEALHQHCETGTFWFFPYRHLQRAVDLRQQRAPFAVGQEAVVPHHFKVSCRDMADITTQHLLLADFLAFVLLRAVIVILMHHGPAAVVAQLRSRHRQALQVASEVFHAAPGAAGLFGEVDFPGAAILRMQVAMPPVFVADMAKAWQTAGIYADIVVAQQVNDGIAPDGFDLFPF
jgi:hypothetical protein